MPCAKAITTISFLFVIFTGKMLVGEEGPSLPIHQFVNYRTSTFNSLLVTEKEKGPEIINLGLLDLQQDYRCVIFQKVIKQTRNGLISCYIQRTTLLPISTITAPVPSCIVR